MMSNEYKDWIAEFTPVQRRNLELCSKYPILCIRSRKDGKVSDEYDYSMTELDDIPPGWRSAFGKEWVQEIQEAINELPEDIREQVYITQLKEKYGCFRQYFSHYTDKLREVIRKYEDKSERICIHCGKPATKISTGWISPWCDDCANVIHDTCVDIDEYFKEIKSDD